jgi:four helix bundle protein
LSETEYLIVLSSDLGYLQRQEAEKPLSEISEIARMLYALRCKVEAGPD